VMEAGNAIEAITRTHARFGTTSLLATTMTAPRDELMAVVAGLGDVAKNRVSGGARVLGVHLEGPYINPGKLGAQPDAAVSAVLDEVLKYLSIAPIRVVTIAPEISGHMEIISEINARGVRVQLGHSLGTYDDAVAAMKHGARSFTHLFNAMSPLHHRNPGMVGAALAHAEYAEIIPDLLHVHPGAIRAAMRAIPRLYVVTDSTSATGMPDGEYRLGSQHVTKCLGGVRLADGTLAGSTLTMDQALRNLVSLGLPMADVSNRMSRYAADYLGIEDRGRLARGAWADVVVFDRELALTATYVEGESIVEYA
ncbi:MAG TPA: N-acetylglucosamine-6-phosphate deacetylase, partial [Paraburkholderia sp.]|nr:N-acetylglucosamine-6-phosphate deacetylase [Paraburkholderia sp.]